MYSVDSHGRMLCGKDGDPFFYLADTAWDLARSLNREECSQYLQARKEQGFTVIQMTALFYPKAVREPNAYGRYPFFRGDTGGYLPEMTPDLAGEYSYWGHLDFVLSAACNNGLAVALLPAWGDLIDDREGKYNLFTRETAYSYGRFIGGRYHNHDNLIWVMGGDRPLDDEKSRGIVNSMVSGIKDAWANQLMTFHPPGPPLLPYSSANYMPQESWMDFHMIQSGHEVLCFDNWNAICRTLALAPGKPVLDAEPRYEDHPACFRPALGYYWDSADVRRTAWWDVMAGACGHTYGNHCIWSFNRTPDKTFPYTWQEALYHPGAQCMRYIPDLLMSRPYFERRPAQELVIQDECLLGHVGACRGDKYAFIYTPDGAPMMIDLRPMDAGTVKAAWYDPRNGTTAVIGIVPGGGISRFIPPGMGKGQDWVLVLDNMDEYLK